MKTRTLSILILLLTLPLIGADWDMSGTDKQRWYMIDQLPAINIETTTEQHQITTHDGKKIALYFKAPEAVDLITRLPGSRWAWPHTGCLMCLHNHLVGTHGQASDYLQKNGWGIWSTIHDNLHNDPTFAGHRGAGRYIGYNIPAPKEPSVFAPTPLDICEKMLEYADITKDDVVYDIGCGDGRILIMAALKYNCRAVGLDIDPKCIKQAQANIDRYKVGHLIRLYEVDARTTNLPDATVVTLYLMPNLTAQLRPRLQSLPSGTRIIAHDKPIPQWKPAASTKIESKADGHEHDIYRWDIGEKVAVQQKSAAKCKT